MDKLSQRAAGYSAGNFKWQSFTTPAITDTLSKPRHLSDVQDRYKWQNAKRKLVLPSAMADNLPKLASSDAIAS